MVNRGSVCDVTLTRMHKPECQDGLVSVPDPNQPQRGSLSVYCKQYTRWIKGLGMRLKMGLLLRVDMIYFGTLYEDGGKKGAYAQ